jgi:hypothetical protein
MSQDIRPILENWPYEPGKIIVRTIQGKNGEEKIQMRLDLGVLQMTMDGRPDGLRPKGYGSWLEYHLDQLDKHKSANDTDLGFHLNGDECQALRDEALMYYHRYLSLFVLEDFGRVERDTDRNLQVLDLCCKYATEEWDQFILEQYRPYILMMNSRSKAFQAMRARMFKTALAHAETGLQAIQEFFEKYDRDEGYAQSSEVQILLALRQEIVQRLPIGAIERLERKLKRALNEQRYEDACKIRDQITTLQDGAAAEA